MYYICHTRYKGIDMNGNEVLIRRRKQLERIGDILYYDGTPICTWRSQVAKEFFANNEDGRGLERGAITHEIAFSTTRYLVDAGGGHQRSQRFSPEQIDTISEEWSHYLNSEHDEIIFNDAFYEADVEELQKMAASLNITV